MAGFVQKALQALHLRKAEISAPLQPASPEDPLLAPQIEQKTTFAPGANEAAEGAKLAEQLGKPQTAEILNKTAQSGIETQATVISSAENKG